MNEILLEESYVLMLNICLICHVVKMEESVPLEMDNHVLDKEDGCYDTTDATFSDDEEELNNKGKMLLVAADPL